MTQSSDTAYAIRAALAASGRLLINRNNVGVAETEYGAKYSFGVGKGSGDYVGCVRMLCPMCLREPSEPPCEYPHHARLVGRHFELEAKSGSGKPNRNQRFRAPAVASFGGYYGVAYTPQEALRHLDRAARGETQPALPPPPVPRRRAR